MCGISFILSYSEECISKKDMDISYLLSHRGPDKINTKFMKINDKITGLFRGCVLWMQGSSPQDQPVISKDEDIFLWNGDNFSFEKNLSECDTLSIFKQIVNKPEEEVVSVLSSVEGPWSFIYYSHSQEKLYFGRDPFGRHSLLWSSLKKEEESMFILCSVATRQDALTEVPALGIYVAEVNTLLSITNKNILLYPFRHVTNEQLLSSDINFVKIASYQLEPHIKMPLCKNIPDCSIIEKLKNFPTSLQKENLHIFVEFLNNEIELFSRTFQNSVQKRVNACPNKCRECTDSDDICTHTKYAVLFSGGLDSALIALYLSKCLPAEEAIDLLNVSFECRHSINDSKRSSQKKSEFIVDFNSPDRKSGLECLNQLQIIDSKRTWNFVEINITSEELKKERNEIIGHLVAPHSSVLDDSIGCALYFCGRGTGTLNEKQYTSPARVVFSGLGADEQLAGYSRHRAKFNEFGWEGLLDEIELEMTRIHHRNCGRDDRVLSHHGRSARFPYLDENVVSCLNSFPIWKKTNLYMPRGIGEKLLLRVIAARNSLTSAAILPKRAIQFGSRIAKLENNKEKGNDICHRFSKLC